MEATSAPSTPDDPSTTLIDAPDDVATRRTSVRRGAVEYGPVAALIFMTVAVNVWWVRTNRVGFPFDIDEAGYLQRSLVDAWHLSNDGLGGFIGQLRGGDPQAPLLPATAAVVRSVTGTGLVGMMLVQQLWYTILVVATWCAARRVIHRWGALAAAVIVATIPAVFISSRTFQFALIAAATVTAALAAQLRAGPFDRLGRAVVWGVLLGIAALSRTMVLGLLPGLVLAATMRVIGAGPILVRLRNLGLGLLAGMLTAWTWYSASWRNVLDYLSSYGYGAHADDYGKQASLLSTTWWTNRPIHIVSDALWAPTTLLLAALMLLGLGGVIAPRVRRAIAAPTDVGPDPSIHRRRRIGELLTEATTSDVGSLVVVVGWSYLALSSTRNTGSSFELPMLPALVILIVALACRNRVLEITTLALAVATGSVVFVADSGRHFDPPASWTIGSRSIEAFDSRGWLRAYSDGFLPPSLATGRADADEYLRAQSIAARTVTDALLDTAAEHDRRPVVFLATQDPFVNTNTIALDAFIATGRLLPMGLLADPAVTGVSLEDRLNEPRYGIPNLVVVGPNASTPAGAAFSPSSTPLAAIPVLRESGFTPVRSVTLPDGRSLEIWWRDAGPAIQP